MSPKKERENKKLRTKNRKLQKEYDEYEKYNTRISEIFVQDTIKDAKRRFKRTFTWRNSRFHKTPRKRSRRNTIPHRKQKHSQNKQLVGIIFQNSIP